MRIASLGRLCRVAGPLARLRAAPCLPSSPAATASHQAVAATALSLTSFATAAPSFTATLLVSFAAEL